MDNWESIKENAQPLKQGHKMSSLAAFLSSPSNKEKLLQEQRKFEIAISANGGSDPLAKWVEYLKWIETVTVGGDMSLDRKDVLERCVSLFRTYEQYKNDTRYLRICLQYADTCSDPLDVFQFLESWQIGFSNPRLYVAWAFVLENLNKSAEADKIFELGASRMSTEEDLSVLHQHLLQFQKRLMAKIEQGEDNEGENEEEALEDENRVALGTMKASKKGKISANRSTAVKQNAGGLGLDKGSLPKGNSLSSAFLIFDDTSAPSMPKSNLREEKKIWNDLPTESATSKENIQGAGRWNKQGGVGGKSYTPSQPSFSIFQEEAPSQERVRSGPINKQVLSNVNPVAFKVAPLQNYVKERGLSRKVADGYLGYDPVAIYLNDEELTFEQVRAIKYMAKMNARKLEVVTNKFASPEHKRKKQNEEHVDAEAKHMEVESSQRNTPTFETKQPIADSFNPEHDVASRPAFRSFDSTLAPEEVRPVPTPQQPLSKFAIFQDETTEPLGKFGNFSLNESYDNKKVNSSLIATSVPSTPMMAAPLKMASVPTPLFSAQKANPSQLNSSQLPDSSFSRKGSSSGNSPTINTKKAMIDVLAMFGGPIEDNEDDEKPMVEAPRQSFPSSKSSFMATTPRLPTSSSAFTIFNEDENADPIPLNNNSSSTPNNVMPVKSSSSSFVILEDAVEEPVVEESAPENQENVPPKVSAFKPFGVREPANPNISVSPSSRPALQGIPQLAKENGDTDIDVPSEIIAPGVLGSNNGLFSGSKHSFQVYEDPENTMNENTATNNFTATNGVNRMDSFNISSMTGTPSNQSFAHSTPFSRSQHSVFQTPGLKPAFTPIVNQIKGGNDSRIMAIREDESNEKHLSPILEASMEGSLLMSSMSSNNSQFSGNSSQLSTPSVNKTTHVEQAASPHAMLYPFSPNVMMKLLATQSALINSLPNFTLSPSEPVPQLEEGSEIAMPPIGKLYVEGVIGVCESTSSYLVNDLESLHREGHEDDENEALARSLIVTVRSFPCPWEFYITNKIHRRLSTSSNTLGRLSVELVAGCAVYKNGAIHMTEYSMDGTLQEVIDLYQKSGKAMSAQQEPLVIYYALELLRVLEAIHGAGIVHGSFIAPKLQLRSGNNGEDDENDNWKPEWNPQGADGWGERGLKLCDFSQSIDLSLVGSDGLRGVPSFTCPIIDEAKPWSFQVDYYGMLDIVHKLLFNESMQLVNEDGRWKLREPMKRFWQVDLWDQLFGTLLNCSDSIEQGPILVSELKKSFEAFMIKNPAKFKTLKLSLTKQAVKLAEANL